MRFAPNAHSKRRIAARPALVCLLAIWLPCAATAQAGNAPGESVPAAQSPAPAAIAPAVGTSAPTADTRSQNAETGEAKLPTESEKRRAAKIFLAAGQLFVGSRFEEAMEQYRQASELDPTNNDYKLSIEVARSHAVTALVQAAAKARLLGDEGTARADLQQALKLDPKNAEATQHLDELGDDALRETKDPLYGDTGSNLGPVPTLAPLKTKLSFHLNQDQHALIRQVFKSFGIDAMFDSSVSDVRERFDVDDATFDEAAQLVGMATGTFFVPVDSHRVLVAKDTSGNRKQFEREEIESIYLPGLSEKELTDVSNVAKNVFGVQSVSSNRDANTVTLHATPAVLTAFNSTMKTLLDGRNQVVLDVRMIQVAHTLARNTGISPPQSIQGFNLYAEEQSILNSNQALVQQIISSGLASANDIPAILAILLASGQISSSLFSNGIATFGGGKAYSAIAPGSLTMNLDLNSSESREIDNIQLRLGDGEDGTIKEGERYPIQTSSYSSLSSGLGGLAGLTGAGTSSSLTSLLASAASTVPTVPMVQYQDLGLTLKANPKVMRDGTVALTLDMKLDSLSGSSINGNPILNNLAFSGVTTLKEGESSVVAAELSRSQSLSISGTPGLSEIPGMNDLTSKDNQYNYATLVIVMTPHVVRGTQAAGHTPMLTVGKVQ